jgi:hypothetical protein
VRVPRGQGRYCGDCAGPSERPFCPTPGAGSNLARDRAPQVATAGSARAARGCREAAISGSAARAPAVAIALVVAALSFATAGHADSAPPPTTPTSTTPDAPPPDPYKAPPKAAPKPSPPRRSAPVVHSAPAVRAPSYSSPVVAPAVPVRSAPVHRTQRTRAKKAVHKRRAPVVHRQAAPKPKPVKVTFNPFANIVASTSALATTDSSGRRDRYLRYAGVAFALLAAAALSLHMQAVRQ